MLPIAWHGMTVSIHPYADFGIATTLEAVILEVVILEAVILEVVILEVVIRGAVILEVVIRGATRPLLLLGNKCSPKDAKVKQEIAL
jgi:hypothetical protein